MELIMEDTGYRGGQDRIKSLEAVRDDLLVILKSTKSTKKLSSADETKADKARGYLTGSGSATTYELLQQNIKGGTATIDDVIQRLKYDILDAKAYIKDEKEDS